MEFNFFTYFCIRKFIVMITQKTIYNFLSLLLITTLLSVLIFSCSKSNDAGETITGSNDAGNETITGSLDLWSVVTYKDGYEIQKYKGPDTPNIVVPTFINDKKVYSLNKASVTENIFDEKEIISIDLSKSIYLENLGYECFINYPYLKHVLLPDRPLSSEFIFALSVFENCSSLESINIPVNTVAINNFLFKDCYALKSIIIPDKTTSIASSSFINCKSLKNVIIGKNVSTIGISTFSGCSSLENIIIPNSVTTIRNNAFQNCTSLENITIPDKITRIEQSTFSYCTSLKNIKLSDNLSFIGSNAFYECTSLENIIIPDNVAQINSSTFERCNSLKSVIIGKKVSTISANAFRNCTLLENIVIPNSVATIGTNSFINTGLKNITLPSIFNNPNDLQRIGIPPNATVATN